MDNPEFMLLAEVAAMLRTPKATLYKWRTEGHGPPARRVGRKLLYRRAEVLAWADAQAAA